MQTSRSRTEDVLRPLTCRQPVQGPGAAFNDHGDEQDHYDDEHQHHHDDKDDDD